MRGCLLGVLLAFVPSCSADDSASTAGCDRSECSACATCYALCVCTTGDAAACQTACAGQGNGGAGGGLGGAGGTGGAGGGAPLPLAAGLRISEVSLYQSVKIPIVQGGIEPNPRNASVVAGRPALVRVFVAPDPDFQPRDVVARLELDGAPAQELVQPVASASVETALQSTFDFEIPPEQLTPDAHYTVSLLEVADAPLAGATDGARWPPSGAALLGAQSTNGPLRVTLVPISVNGYTPGTNAQQVEQIRNRVFAMYPVSTLELDVRAAVSFPGGVSAGGSGWSEVLSALLSLRQQDGVDDNVFYYGLLAPAQSMGSYCGGACVAGLGPQPDPNDDWARGAIGLGFFPDGSNGDAPDTMAHEFGHAFGRPHSPCGTGDADPSYPYSGGGIGSWGYDLGSKQLKDPGVHKDILSYCDPVWISDYTYERIFQRLAYVNANPLMLPRSKEAAAGEGAYRVIVENPEGSWAWGSALRISRAPSGRAVAVDVIDERGASHVLAAHELALAPAGRFVLVSESAIAQVAGAHSARVRVPGARSVRVSTADRGRRVLMPDGS